MIDITPPVKLCFTEEAVQAIMKRLNEIINPQANWTDTRLKQAKDIINKNIKHAIIIKTIIIKEHPELSND